jgi:enediyne biosynthesis protein E4
MLVALCAGGWLAVSGRGRAPVPQIPASQQQTTSPPAASIFRDVAEEAGVKFQWGHGGRTPLDIVETLGHGCAFVDYDRDGLLDIVLVGNKNLALFRNVGSGKFKDVSSEVGLTATGMFNGIAVGDYDNDGYPDMYISGYGKCVLYRNTGQGGFEDVTARAGVGALHAYDNVTAAAFADLDGDSRLELIATRYIRFTPDTIHFCTYNGVRAGCGPKNYDPDRPRVYRNLGNGAFKDVTQAWGMNALLGRCLGIALQSSEDGRGVAFYCANDELAGNLMRRGKDGRYEDIGLPSGTAYNRDGLTQGGMGVDWGDFNNDGRMDLVVATFQNEPKSLYRNDGNQLYSEIGGTFGLSAVTTAYIAWTVKFIDYDNDGWLDLFITNGHSQDNAEAVEKGRTYAQPLQLFHNEAGTVFRPVGQEAGTAFSVPIVGRGAAFGDYDNDGRVDAVLVNEEGPVLLLHNEAQTGNHWLGVKLVGTRSDRDAIGARVELIRDGGKLVREQQTCGGYISSHDPRLLFGLGKSGKVDSLRVRWPDGSIQTVTDVPTDRYITITQGVDSPPESRQ